MSGMNPEKKSLDSQSKIKKIGNSYVLYDASIITDPGVQLFDVDYHTKHDARQKNSSSSNDRLNLNTNQNAGIGRARVVYFSLENRPMVLKHYYRGGAVALISKDKYLGVSVVKSRSFREWRLLKRLDELGLPVPVAVAAHVKKGLFFYSADLITEEIENSKTLIDALIEKPLTRDGWQSVGACIKRFHENNVYHADLNARNILLAPSGKVYLIDFDNSGFRVDAKSWKMANMARLKRSLLKFKNNLACHFDESDWNDLLDGYKNTLN